ncbi:MULTISPECIES: mycofactocin-coupled SDR family oxidoreductase [Pseudonocardia]|uniref:Short-chain dehydrogenase/reductase n=2 Tax=Pseudonocardia TaxID=1847 RepID=A0ABQ0S9C4_9PSEU|nr:MULTISPECIES: mycofactocin-coupled SDR family oxidoreductase [Pseudonocardia]OSY34537.1 putative short-chain type dehydrogenase/reductase [Pseudonocardia autotrophica]TDN75431.1 SDR family mycofactocin-dependent oxidoreductase [Pseudonocardia autotrophica]BBF99393.1 short-chain dehydrogenase/reductase [Pseudonocardia autotrophica]GEC29519.1 short-chain dehydrogenase/reductase [Pseudonocardia saturnea]
MSTPQPRTTGRFQGRTVLITGAARGQGRSHALALAAEGADVIALDICHDIDTVAYDLATEADLNETVEQVRGVGRRAIGLPVDVRDAEALAATVTRACAELAVPDVVLANAGIGLMKGGDGPAAFRDQLDVNLTGVWNTVQATAPHLIEQRKGGAMVLTSSVFGLTGRGGDGQGGSDGYVAGKHGVVGLMRTFATWLAPHGIRVNCVNPSGVATRMILNPAVEALFGGGTPPEQPKSTDDVANLLDVSLVQPEDVTAAVTFLASDEARYITGVALPVDAGMLVR